VSRAGDSVRAAARHGRSAAKVADRDVGSAQPRPSGDGVVRGFDLQTGGVAQAGDPALRGVGGWQRMGIGLALWAAAVLGTPAQASTAAPRPDGAVPLTAQPGDPARGRAIVVDRYKGLCLLCHSGPFPEQAFQGNFAPDLGDVGLRLSLAQLRQRIIDSRQLNPHSMMPSYHRTEGLHRVAPAFRGKPILTAQEVEDVVMFLSTLRGATSTGSTP
jgi:sulfur-oxidizing protein SoxX